MTEKNYNPQQKEKKAMKKQEVVEKVKKPIQPTEAPKKVEEKKVETPKVEEQKTPVKPVDSNKDALKDKQTSEPTGEATTEKPKAPVKKEVPKVKKTEVFARGVNLPISTKDAKFICKFIMKKRLGDAIRDLKQVELGRKAVPMTGEIPHRKGKRISSGRFPKKAAKNFGIILKSLAANANEGSIDEPIIVEAMANQAARPYGRFGRTQKKRTHVKVIVKEKSKIKKKKEKKK
jgi:ribosomal protein L22